MADEDDDAPSFDLFAADPPPPKQPDSAAAAVAADTSSASASAAPATAAVTAVTASSSTASSRHVCWFCALRFDSAQALDAHLLRSGHFVCSDCLPTKRVFSTKATYRQHRSVHRIMRKYGAGRKGPNRAGGTGVLFDEAWLHVFAYVDAQALTRCESVCTQFQALVSSERCWDVWKHLVVSFCHATAQRPPNTNATGVTVHWKKVYEHFAVRNLTRVRMQEPGRDGQIYQYVRLLTYAQKLMCFLFGVSVDHSLLTVGFVLQFG
jgi:hypothetical protein